ncbi:hypothetical protein RJT34_16475 [Clitoria ternatea]|uniref:Uncharacterized protein n=1 Tax=Clitoria ternatea TaxID=43366 RepID=A0AAN9J793_CLITE
MLGGTPWTLEVRKSLKSEYEAHICFWHSLWVKNTSAFGTHLLGFLQEQFPVYVNLVLDLCLFSLRCGYWLGSALLHILKLMLRYILRLDRTVEQL